MSRLQFKIWLLIFLLSVDCQNYQTIDINGQTMGTNYKIAIINQSNKRIDVQLLQNQIDSLLIEINNIFSNYINSSEISNINRHLSTSTINISIEMNEVINTAIQIYELSNGKFDITIKPLVDIWGFGENYDTSQFPSDELIKKTKEYVGF